MLGQQIFKTKIFIFSLFILFVSTSNAFAIDSVTGPSPDQILNNATDELLLVINRDREKIKNDPEYVMEVVKKYLIPHVDFVSAARWVLGKHERTAEKKESGIFSSSRKGPFPSTTRSSIFDKSGKSK